jgi:hypothetical protein
VLDSIVHEGGEAPNASNKYNRDELSALICIQHEELPKDNHTPQRAEKAGACAQVFVI